MTQPIFPTIVHEYEQEKASNSYLMSLVAVIVGLPLPIINLVATGIFYLANRRSTYFVRFHCMQALLSQSFIIMMNSAGLYWTLGIIFNNVPVTDNYVGYMITIALFNIIEFIATVYAAIQVRKGKHVELFFFGELTHLFCKP